MAASNNCISNNGNGEANIENTSTNTFGLVHQATSKETGENNGQEDSQVASNMMKQGRNNEHQLMPHDLLAPSVEENSAHLQHQLEMPSLLLESSDDHSPEAYCQGNKSKQPLINITPPYPIMNIDGGNRTAAPPTDQPGPPINTSGNHQRVQNCVKPSSRQLNQQAKQKGRKSNMLNY